MSCGPCIMIPTFLHFLKHIFILRGELFNSIVDSKPQQKQIAKESKHDLCRSSGVDRSQFYGFYMFLLFKCTSESQNILQCLIYCNMNISGERRGKSKDISDLKSKEKYYRLQCIKLYEMKRISDTSFLSRKLLEHMCNLCQFCMFLDFCISAN